MKQSKTCAYFESWEEALTMGIKFGNFIYGINKTGGTGRDYFIKNRFKFQKSFRFTGK